MKDEYKAEAQFAQYASTIDYSSVAAAISQDHCLIQNPGGRALTCQYCKLVGNKTDCGWHVKCYYRCKACDIPLCTGKRNCFNLYHNLIPEQK